MRDRIVATGEIQDRSDGCRAAVRAFRSRRVLPASLAASLLTVAGATVSVQVISARFGHPVLHPEITVRLLHTLTWSDPELMSAGGGLMLAGLSLVLAAVLPGRTGTAPLAGDDPRFITGLGRSSLRADLHSTVLGVAGVETAVVRLRGRLRPRVEIRAVTGFHNSGNLGELVADAVRDRLEDLGPVRVPEVAVRVACRKH
ncbi:MAG TPA: DUF6286 domain-containing protein [Actinoallomurus sp.]|nr:DUF6286 domain-containing protein [Actinoallomurus sp.]